MSRKLTRRERLTDEAKWNSYVSGEAMSIGWPEDAIFYAIKAITNYEELKYNEPLEDKVDAAFVQVCPKRPHISRPMEILDHARRYQGWYM